MEDDSKKYFTLIFEGDIAQFQMNPLRTTTPFGTPLAAGRGNAFTKIDDLTDKLEMSEFNASMEHKNER